LRAAGHDVTAVRTDVSREQDVRALAEAALDTYGAVHILCNNAGVESGASFSDVPLRTWQWVMDVNFWGVLYGCREFLPLLRDQGDGHIVNTASMSALSAEIPTMAPYTCSKFAVLALSECLDAELRMAGDPVGVSVITPGPVNTRMSDSERNRPGDVPGTEPDQVRQQVKAALRSATQTTGLDPAIVAEQVLDAIRRRRFFVLPHRDRALAAVERRLRWMADGERPVPQAPNGAAQEP
jgi:NAD(P)-dependent dehydrogenase (short-subunit alcohol dehydrogenase family)